jgi:hypothetical protein
LFKDSILITNTIAPGGNVESSKRINEASCQTTETTISKGGITFLLIELLEIVTHIHKSILELVL